MVQGGILEARDKTVLRDYHVSWISQDQYAPKSKLIQQRSHCFSWV